MEALLHHPILYPILAFLGACFGSFISLVSYRIPRELPWIAVRSRCPSCGTALSPRDLMPILSYLLSGRKCRHCGVRLSVRYVLLELSMAASFVALYAWQGPNGAFIILAGLSVCVMTLIVTDLEHYMIPDTVQAGMFLLGLAWVFSQNLPVDDRLINAAMLFGIGLSLHYGYFWLMGKHGLGFGDVKLLASVGLWIPMMSIPAYLMLSGLLGVFFALAWRVCGLGRYFPFGPALVVAMLFIVIYPPAGYLFGLFPR